LVTKLKAIEPKKEAPMTPEESKNIEEKEKQGTFLKEVKKIEIIDCYEATEYVRVIVFVCLFNILFISLFSQSSTKKPHVMKRSDEFDMRNIIQESYRSGLNGIPPDDEAPKATTPHVADHGCRMLHASKLIGHDEFNEVPV
jgi:hypothetical protein